MQKLLNLKFLVTLSAIGCVQWALIASRIDGPVYAALLSAAVAGFMALDWLGNKVQP